MLRAFSMSLDTFWLWFLTALLNVLVIVWLVMLPF